MEKSILQNARSFFAGTTLSRASGVMRDITMAAAFGGSAEVASFFIAYRFANLLRRLLGEGNIQSGFIPHYVALKEEGPKFYRDTVFSMGLVLLFVVASFDLALYALQGVVSEEWGQILELSMWMSPGLFFICLYGLNSALLQCQKKYFLPSVAPVLFNVIWIAAAFYRPEIYFLAWVITVAFFWQWFVTIFEGFLILPWREWLKPKLFSPHFRALIKPLSLGIVGIGATQINSALDPVFAKFADGAGPAFLWYALRLQQLPFALFGLALSSALLPAISKAEDKGALLKEALFQAAFFMIFCTFAIFALGPFGVNFCYGHGGFSTNDVQNTVFCLWGYGLGLLPSVFILLYSGRYYAEKDYTTPAKASLFAVLINTALNALFVFVFGWGALSVAIATSIAAFCNVAYLSKGLPKELWLFILKISASCALPAAAVMALQLLYFVPYPRDLLAQAIQLGVASCLYIAFSFFLLPKEYFSRLLAR